MNQGCVAAVSLQSSRSSTSTRSSRALIFSLHMHGYTNATALREGMLHVRTTRRYICVCVADRAV